MKFKLIVNGSGVHQPDEAVIRESLSNNLGEHENYVLLEPKEPINNNIYLQVMFDEHQAGYILETRFMYDDESFKHYEYMTSDLKEVQNIFLEYFKKHTLSSLSDWQTDSEEEDDYMRKLYKKTNDQIFYAEFWANEDGDCITIHRGLLGQVGETEDLILEEGDSLPFFIEKLENEYTQQAYKAQDELDEIIIQYVLTPTDDEIDILETLENEMNEALGWTGNGHCEGGDIEGSVVSIFCQVVDKQIALGTMLEILGESGLLSNITISSPNDITEEYEVLFPL